MCEHYWADITTMEYAGKERQWICSKCIERMTTEGDGPFEQSDEDIQTLEVDMEFPRGTARLDGRMTDAERLARMAIASNAAMPTAEQAARRLTDAEIGDREMESLDWYKHDFSQRSPVPPDVKVFVKDESGESLPMHPTPAANIQWNRVSAYCTSDPRARMNDAELIAALRRKPYDRACREAARRLEELLRDTKSPNGASD